MSFLSKMQEKLFLLILLSQVFMFTCKLYEYVLIQEKKTWAEAQRYCRDNHTDLATVFDQSDMATLCGRAQDAWIGLYNISGKENRTWHWSLPELKYDENEENWWGNEPNDFDGLQNCGMIIKDSKWADHSCGKKLAFICYNGKTQTDRKFHFNKDKLTWGQAQRHCRTHHTDLVSGRQQLDELSRDVSVWPSELRSSWLWIGLFRDTWRWSNGNTFSIRHWENVTEFEDDSSRTNRIEMCAKTEANATWSSDNCHAAKRFFCYDDYVFLIKESLTWAEALYYCRRHHRELVTITNQDEQRWVQEKAKMADTPYVWLGLRYTCTLDFWFWVSDEVVKYKNWASTEKTDDCDMSGAMDRGGEHKWFKKIDDRKFNFICSDI